MGFVFPGTKLERAKCIRTEVGMLLKMEHDGHSILTACWEISSIEMILPQREEERSF